MKCFKAWRLSIPSQILPLLSASGSCTNPFGIESVADQSRKRGGGKNGSTKQIDGRTKQGLEKLNKSMGGMIQAIALTVETRDPYTAGHQEAGSGFVICHWAGDWSSGRKG